MTESDSEAERAKPAPGPGVSAWLQAVVGAPRPASSKGAPALPDWAGGASERSKRFAIRLPAALMETDDGELKAVEFRDVPAGAVISHGTPGPGGAWSVAPTSLEALTIDVAPDTEVPFRLTAKFLFSDKAGGSLWNELAGVDVGASEEEEGDKTGDKPTRLSPGDAPAMPTMAVVDLDVSVGIDDPAALAKITLAFDGLPEGASLNAGAVDDAGAWVVPATDLETLSVILPDGTPPFELNVEMRTEGETPQSATIRVAPEEPGDAPEQSMIAVRLAPPEPAAPVRFKVFTDGTLTYDRVIQWSEGPDVPVDIHVVEADEIALPFEILMRYETIGLDSAAGPRLLGIDLAGETVAADSPAVTAARGESGPAGRTWQGDLIVDVRLATRAADQPAPAPPETNEVEPAETAPRPAPSAPAAEETEQDILIVDATMDDLRSPAFLEELRNLRRFIRARVDGGGGDRYERLDLDVGKWRDMRVVGPGGAPVVLDPPMTALAPPGGADNTRTLRPLRLPENTAGKSCIVSGLPPGALLSRGINLGDGTWRVPAGAEVLMLPPLYRAASATVRIVPGDESGNAAPDVILVGSRLERVQPGPSAYQTIRVALDKPVFDPEGYGSLTLTIGSVPSGVLLNKGVNHGDGVWTLELPSGDGFSLLARAETRDFSISVTCVALNTETGDSKVVSRMISVRPRRADAAVDNAEAAE